MRKRLRLCSCCICPCALSLRSERRDIYHDKISISRRKCWCLSWLVSKSHATYFVGPPDLQIVNKLHLRTIKRSTYSLYSLTSLVAVQYSISPEARLTPKSSENSFAYNLFISLIIVLKFWPEHDSDTALLLLHAKFQNDWTTKTGVMNERYYTRFEIKMSVWRISYIAQHPSLVWPLGFPHLYNGLQTRHSTYH